MTDTARPSDTASPSGDEESGSTDFRAAEGGGTEVSARFASLQIPAYRWLFWGGVFSFMAVQMQFLLRGLLAWDLTERESTLGYVYLAFGLALLVFTPFGGVASERLRKRRLLLGGQVALTIFAVFMATVVLLDIAELWMLILASVGQGAMFGLTGPARVAMAGELVGRERLGNAISLSTMSMNGSRIFAPSFAGVLAGVAFFGIGGAYLIASIFSMLSFLLVFRLPDLEPVSQSDRSPIGDIVDGVRYVSRTPRLRRIIVTSTIAIMFGFNYVAFLPALVEGEFGQGEAWVGFISTASSIGALAASFWFAGKADGAGRMRLLVLSGIGFGASVALLSATPNIVAAMVVVLGVGAATTGFQILSNSIVLTTADASHQGRVQSLMQLSFAGFGMAAAPLGAFAEATSLRTAILVMGAVTLAASVLLGVMERRSLAAAVAEPTGHGDTARIAA